MPKVLRIHQPIGIDGLRIDEVPLATPPENYVRIKVSACGLNWGDVDYMRDNYTESLAKLPARFGGDTVGIIDAIGTAVDSSWLEQRVCSIPYFYGPNGEHGEFALIDQNYIVPAYEGFTDIQAASVWGQYTTAYFGLIKQGKLETGQNILISAATSTAGIAAIKVANMIGAKTICTTRSEKSRDFLYEMGATSVLVSKDNELCEEIKSITKNEGISLVYDPIGGKFFDQYLYALAQDAIIILYGGIDDSPINLDLETQLELTKRNAALRFFSVQNYTHDMIEARKFIENGFKSGKLPAIVDRTYSFQDYKQAYAYMGAKRESHGKIILTID
jgi:NADPH2:quinone reductase